jgi:hypothetical protein
VDVAWTTRLYASSIAIVSGLYAIAMALAGMVGRPMMAAGGIGPGGWTMLVVGIVVLVHGIVLVTPASARLGQMSGPLMVVWALIMLANQGLLAAVPGWGMQGSPMGSSMTSGMGWDAGMVAIAILMLASGLIMRGGRMDRTRR